MVDAGYAAAVKETFETKPLRTVLMIDDQFPSLADMIRGGPEDDNKFKQKQRALALYEGFRKRHMICDVENDAKEVHSDRFRKSDLIILDYNLGPGEDDNEQSLRVLRDLANSKHFNTVVVYTAEPRQDDVWLSVIGALSGGWTSLPGDLEGEAQEHWDRLADDDALPDVTMESLRAYACRRQMRDIPKDVADAARQELTHLGVPQNAATPILEALLHREMARRSEPWGSSPRKRAVGGCMNGVRWVQSHNSFITILQKKEELADHEDDPYGIMECLSNALLAWRPNLIQVLISEIQNVLELEALATEDEQLGEPEMQAALWYYVLQAVGKLDLAAEPDVRNPISKLVDKLVDGIRTRLVADDGLSNLASTALLGELRDAGWADDWPDTTKSTLVQGAAKLARVGGKVDQDAVLFRLNNFLSTEKIRRDHLTTGTVFRAGEEFLIAASPACDLVARRPSKYQDWAHEIHPLTAFVAVRLLAEKSISGPLSDAANGRHVFLTIDGEYRAFKIVNAVQQPSYEFLFAAAEGRVREQEGQVLFEASRLRAGDDDSRTLTEETFEVVGQLQGLNAHRLLQTAGQHLSRIGLDFVSLPKT